MRHKRGDKSWSSRPEGAATDPVMRFSQEGLVFGAGTVLAKSHGGDRNLSIDPLDPRLHALLAAAHLRRPSALALAHLRKAAERWREGDDALAAMHLTLSGLDRLAEPETDAHRMFQADGLLRSGVEATTVIGAVEAGGTALDGLRKFDPDQPRVPAGSGRTSGEWTSTGGNPSTGLSQDAGQQSDASHEAMTSGAGASLQPLVYQPQSDPSPGSAASDADSSLVYRPGIDPAPTFTEVTIPPIVSIEACRIAHTDCVTAAAEAASKDGDDEVPRHLDWGNCNKAEIGCELMSWGIEDIPFIAGTGQGGGVLFPHGGVVLIRKGMLDYYYPPYPDGRPSFRRSTGVGTQRDPGKALRVEGNLCPPWCVSPDERIVSSPASEGFSSCRKILGLFTARTGATVTKRVCSMSTQWGRVIRAKIAYTSGGVANNFLVTCWYSNESHMGIFMKADGCCGRGDGCP